jgi:hypothetical protein
MLTAFVTLTALISVIFGCAFYMLPTIIALFRKKASVLAIGVLNFFLGWSLIGWIVALVWALSADTSATIVIHNHNDGDS